MIELMIRDDTDLYAVKIPDDEMLEREMLDGVISFLHKTGRKKSK